MPFCPACEQRPAHCIRRCERQARGKHLWDVIQHEMMRCRPGADMAHLAFDQQSAELQAAFAVGAQAIREMPR